MELPIAFAVSAALVALYSVCQAVWKGHKLMQQSLTDREAFISARAKFDANQPRVLVRLGRSCQIFGWSPCQRVVVPAGEYITYLSKFTHNALNGAEDSLCFIDVPQQWRGESMKRDVFVRIADYPFLTGFPQVADTQHIQVLSHNL
jgi:hypothetical protein